MLRNGFVEVMSEEPVIKAINKQIPNSDTVINHLLVGMFLKLITG